MRDQRIHERGKVQRLDRIVRPPILKAVPYETPSNKSLLPIREVPLPKDPEVVGITRKRPARAESVIGGFDVALRGETKSTVIMPGPLQLLRFIIAGNSSDYLTDIPYGPKKIRFFHCALSSLDSFCFNWIRILCSSGPAKRIFITNEHESKAHRSDMDEIGFFLLTVASFRLLAVGGP